VQGCLFHKCNECSLSNTSCHLVLTKLARISLGMHFPILLRQTNRQYLVWLTVSVTQEACRTLHRVASDMRKRVSACIPERGAHFKQGFLFYDFNVIYFLKNRTCVRNDCVTFRLPCVIYKSQINSFCNKNQLSRPASYAIHLIIFPNS
jgi:hypothetical protein